MKVIIFLGNYQILLIIITVFISVCAWLFYVVRLPNISGIFILMTNFGGIRIHQQIDFEFIL